jgi:glycosyltransferase involved in cell wall biosynthesis
VGFLQMSKPRLSNTGHAVIFTSTYLRREKTGSTLVMHELLSCFDPKSFSVITATGSGPRSAAAQHGHSVFCIMHNIYLSERLNTIWRLIQMPVAVRLAIGLVRRLRPSVIVGVYPELEFLAIAQRVAASQRIPWVAYLHDVVINCDPTTLLGWVSRRIKADTFRDASRVCVISEGMADHYRNEDGLEMTVLTHICSQQPIPPCPVLVKKRAFMGGSIYDINAHAAARISKALACLGAQFVITSPGTETQLAALGIHGQHVVHARYVAIQDYQGALSESAFLVLALDWPDETEREEHVLGTIFPTRTMEYLTSGRPILVHCPERYFLARFFRKHGCGMVLSDRSDDAVRLACSRMLSDHALARELVEQARQTALLFSAEKVAGQFGKTVAEAGRMRWGQKSHV